MSRIVVALAALAAGFVAFVFGRRSVGSSVVSEVGKRTHLATYVPHSHEAVVHAHEHPHVTHNRREGPDEVMGEWEHLTGLHEHEHNHSMLEHRHLAHEDAAHEHLGEAHIHDHSHPTSA
jgi:hypothetical protein